MKIPFRNKHRWLTNYSDGSTRKYPRVALFMIPGACLYNFPFTQFPLMYDAFVQCCSNATLL